MKIKSITKKEKVDVYDIIDVEDNNNYIANGFIVHNSAAEWNKRENKTLKRKLAEVRTKHLLFILCFPLKVNKVESNYLQAFTNYWCLTGDTKIKTRDKNGIIRNTPIKKLNKFNPEVLTFNEQTKTYEFKEYDKKILSKKNAKIHELELENGLKIKCTEDHPFLTQRGWVRLKDLKEEDSIEVDIKGGMLIKIKKIRKLKSKEDVYDIVGVKDNHNFIANNMVVHNCDLFARGKGAIYIKDKNPIKDAWNLKAFEKLGSFNEFTQSSAIEKKLSKHPNFWKIITFPKPPRWLYERYLKVRERNVYDDDNILHSVGKEDIHKALLVLALRDIMVTDESKSMNRIILHIRNKYDISLPSSAIQAVLKDSKDLIQRVREQALEA